MPSVEEGQLCGRNVVVPNNNSYANEELENDISDKKQAQLQQQLTCVSNDNENEKYRNF